MDVFVANEQGSPIDEIRTVDLARHALSEEDASDATELSILFVTRDHIRRLNHRFAGDDYATDVLAFPMLEEGEDESLLGDVVVCPSVAEEHAQKIGHPLTRELDTLVVHGILHLLGYDHQGKEDKARMERRQQELLDSFERVPSR